MGTWSAIKSKGASDKNWRFAVYREYPSERPDKRWYSAFLFRNEDRTQFGIQEWFDELPHHQTLRRLAMRVLKELEFRNSLLSDRGDLPAWWKKK
jgi:hypothetical protein